mgnify:FL=1
MRKLLYLLSWGLVTFILMGCVPDANPAIDSGDSSDGATRPVEICLGVASDATAGTRAGSDYTDVNMQAGELMKNWIIVMVDADNRIVDIVANGPYDAGETERSQDSFWKRMKQGTYTFYSFANLTRKEIGIDTYRVGDTLPAGFFEHMKCSVKIPSLFFADHWSDFGNDYFPQGIPMSNKQVVTIGKDTKVVHLEVIRMVAKVVLQLTNNTDHDITFRGLTLSDVTPNVADNLMLLPGKDETDEQGIVHVSDANLATTQKQTVAYASMALGTGHDYVVKRNGQAVTNICFYINESKATDENKYHILQLQTIDSDHSSTVINRRLAMLNWSKICRNDYRVIPIKLDDYSIEWDVQSFTPIGVLPQIEDDGENLTITMGYYGEFHIIPKVRQLSTGYYSAVQSGSFKWVTGSKDIFDVEPQWSLYGKRVEGEMANMAGSSVYALTLTVNKDIYGEEQITLTRKVRFVMNSVNLK